MLLSETGELRFCYLGTDPMIFMAPDRPANDYKDIKNQLVQLKKDLQNVSLQDGDCLIHHRNTLRCIVLFYTRP